MKEISSIDQVKRIELDILNYVNEVLQKNGIEYWLDSGTLLGCIRHKGFIPWDDDIDIAIRRKDYYRAIDLLNEGDGPYKVLTMDNTEEYFYLFAKVIDTRTYIKEKNLKEIKDLGIYIDIFPLDSLPDDEKKYKQIINRVFRLRSMIYYSLLDKKQIKNANIKKKIKHHLGRLYGTRNALYKADQICRFSSNNYYGYIANIVAANNKSRKIPQEVFAETVYMDFEGKKYPVPKGFDKYLRILYGDYMELPPVKDRIFTHDFKAYWR